MCFRITKMIWQERRTVYPHQLDLCIIRLPNQTKPNQTKSTKSNLHTKCAFALRKIWQEHRTVNPHQLDLCIFRLLNTNCWNLDVGSGEIEGQRRNWEWWRRRVKEGDISSSYLFYSSIWVSFPSFLFFFPSFLVSFSYSCVSYASMKKSFWVDSGGKEASLLIYL